MSYFKRTTNPILTVLLPSRNRFDMLLKTINSFANSAIVPYQSVVINYGDGDYDSHPYAIDGEVGIWQQGYYPNYYYTEIILRYDVRIPKTTTRDSVSGSIDFVLVYTYTT